MPYIFCSQQCACQPVPDRALQRILAALSHRESECLQASTLPHPYVLCHPQDYETLCLAVSLLSRQARHQDALELCTHMRRALEAEPGSVRVVPPWEPPQRW